MKTRTVPALGLIEEAVHLLRQAPASVFAAYFVGTVPFLIGLLYFWADMSRGAYAYRHVGAAALAMTALYLWMKSWQAVFARQLLARRSGQPGVTWNRPQLAHLVFVQAVLQPTQFFVLPVAALVMLPFAWVYALYHNLPLVSDDPAASLRTVIRRAWRQAGMDSWQNHLVVSLVWLFGLFVFLNLYTAVLAAPFLLKMLLGLDSVFTRSPAALLNTTLLAAVCALTYLCINPLVKAVYVLRCFYNESRQSGADLRAELKVLTVTALLLLVTATGSIAQDKAAPAAAPAAPERAAQLDRAIDNVLTQPQYTWRMPRESAPPAEQGAFMEFLSTIGRMLRNWWRAAADWVDSVLIKLRRFFSRLGGGSRADGQPADWADRLQLLMFLLIVVAAACLGVLVYRIWRQRRRQSLVLTSQPAAAAVPDLRDEHVLADQLPVEGWLAKARELLAQGDRRLALRALFLASLAHLAQRERILIARAKSNRDYERELRRRAHGEPALVEPFAQNVHAFERAWYGWHEVTEDGLTAFWANVDRLREVA